MGLKELVRKHIDQYFEELDGEIPQDLYDLVVDQGGARFTRGYALPKQQQPIESSRDAWHQPGTLRTRMKLFGLLS